jgi:hypothetical protein
MIERLRNGVFMAALLLLAIPLQTQTTSAQTPKAATPSTNDDINPDATAALNAMGSYLRTLKSFQVTAVTTKDDVLDDGELIQFDPQVNLLARMPDRLRVEITNAQKHQLYFYDGKTLTLYAQRVNYYASVPAPPTIGKLANDLNGQVRDRDAARRPLLLGRTSIQSWRNQGCHRCGPCRSRGRDVRTICFPATGT